MISLVNTILLPALLSNDGTSQKDHGAGFQLQLHCYQEGNEKPQPLLYLSDAELEVV